jgi:hypothetical protein
MTYSGGLFGPLFFFIFLMHFPVNQMLTFPSYYHFPTVFGEIYDREQTCTISLVWVFFYSG